MEGASQTIAKELRFGAREQATAGRAIRWPGRV